jgi:cyclophilin family peptidyl-prolyl cis-trans isomerase
MPVRPAPLRESAEIFESAAILHPTFSPHAFLETRYGTIEVELNVVEAPLTTRNFIELSRAGFFNGVLVHRLVPNFVVQAGDPRGDGEGGPGYSIKDELSPLPYVRGTLGMALSGPDTGGSQFFLTVSPQPHLDGKYTVFGHVVQGLEILDQISQWDAIERVRIWDGVTLR